MPESRSSASPQLTVAGLVERHRRTWLADAAAYLRVLDWQGLSGRQLVLLDFEDVPNMPPQRSIAFTSPGGLFELVRPYVKASGLEPGPAMFINTKAMADFDVGQLSEADAAWITRVVINAVAIHEYAHNADYEARGVILPAGTTLATILDSTPTPPQVRSGHSAGWLRAYAHLIYRSMATPSHQDHYLDRFRSDVKHQGLGLADDYLDAIAADVDRHGIDLPLVEILRSPAPAGFVELFQARDAARSANR
jgi:hypothetical protein